MRSIFLTLAAEHPDDLTYQGDLVDADLIRAAALRSLSRHGEADAAHVGAENRAADLVARRPDVAEHRDRLISARDGVATDLFKAGRWKEALAGFQEAFALAEERNRLFPPTRSSRGQLARLHANIGTSHMYLKANDDAVRYLTLARDRWAEIVVEAPADSDALESLAGVWNKLVYAYREREQPAQSVAAGREAVRVARDLITRQPTLPSARSLLAQCCHNLASVLTDQNQHAEALALREEATVLLEKLAADFSPISEHAENLGPWSHERAILEFRQPYKVKCGLKRTTT